MLKGLAICLELHYVTFVLTDASFIMSIDRIAHDSVCGTFTLARLTLDKDVQRHWANLPDRQLDVNQTLAGD